MGSICVFIYTCYACMFRFGSMWMSIWVNEWASEQAIEWAGGRVSGWVSDWLIVFVSACTCASMYVCMNECVYLCLTMCVCTHACVSAWVCTCVRACVRAWVSVCMCAAIDFISNSIAIFVNIITSLRLRPNLITTLLSDIKRRQNTREHVRTWGRRFLTSLCKWTADYIYKDSIFQKMPNIVSNHD